MKVSVIISACDNREKFFTRSLDTWVNQTFLKEHFEIVIIDDAERILYDRLCEKYQKLGLNFQLIRIDKTKSTIPVKTFIPVLSNNVGIKNAHGEVIVITGPETLQYEKNLERSYLLLDKPKCAYGLVYKSDLKSVSTIEENWDTLKTSFLSVLKIPGTQAECLTRRPHPPGYLYFMAVSKQHALDIGGFDEMFLGGLCAEDDDFANRMKIKGIIPYFENSIIGLHQNHSGTDKSDNVHLSRYSEEGRKLWNHNLELMKKNLSGNGVVNSSFEWGSEKLITYKKIYEGEK